MADIVSLRCIFHKNRFLSHNIRFLKPLSCIQGTRSHHTSQKCGRCSKPQNCDKIEYANIVNNLRPSRFGLEKNESLLEIELRKYQQELQEWNQLFWTKHNESFAEAKKKFEHALLKSKDSTNQSINADEMSVFYKQFLDGHWTTHFTYLSTWYRKHFYVTFLHLKVLLLGLVKRIM